MSGQKLWLQLITHPEPEAPHFTPAWIYLSTHPEHKALISLTYASSRIEISGIFTDKPVNIINDKVPPLIFYGLTVVINLQQLR